MKVKITSLLYILSLMSLTAFGQKYSNPPNNPEFDLRKWKFGFTLGTEFQNFKITNNSYSVLNETGVNIPESTPESTVTEAYYHSEVPELIPGFHVGIITSRRLGEHFNLRIIPSLSLGQRTVESKLFVKEEITDGGYYTRREVESEAVENTIKSTYMSLPIMIKYKAVRINNWRPYMIAGTNLKYDLATDIDDPITLNHVDAGIELGLGSDFYLETFRLGIELRFGIGLLNVLETNRPEGDSSPYLTSSMDNIKTKTFTISINFE